MIKNYFKTAIRNLGRNKTYTAINILGLAVGIATCLLLFLVIQFELSFDRFHKHKERIYRVVSEFKKPDGVFYSSGVPLPVPDALRADFPELENVAAITGSNDDLVAVLDDDEKKPVKKFKEASGTFLTEPQFLEMFDFPLLAGDKKTVLTEPNTAVLSKATAEKYFGNWKDAIGRSVKVNNRRVFKITGILKEVEEQTDFPLKLLLSYATLKASGNSRSLTDWVTVQSQAYCFVKFPEGMNPEKFNASLASLTKKYKPTEYRGDGLIVQPLSEMHFDNRFGNFNEKTFSRDLIKALTLIGIFILVIACVNFINLATAQAVNRSKEVGVRKVMGSNRMQLSLQYLSETAVITFSAVLFAIVIAWLSLPFLNKLLESNVQIRFFSNPLLIVFLIVTGMLVTILSGVYPAVVLSRFNPIVALKTRMSASMVGGVSLRKALVGLQFTIAHVLIIGTLIIVQQMNYFKNASLGFDKQAIVTVPIPADSVSRTKIDYLRDQLSLNAGIRNLSFSFAAPSNNGSWNSDFRYDHSAKSTSFNANLKWADPDYFKTYNLEFIAGRPYFKSDTVRELVVNETMVKKLGLQKPEDIIGKEFNFWNGEKVGTVTGVIKDFHASSLRDPISPVVLGTWKNVYRTIGIKINAGKINETLSFIEKTWSETFPEHVYEYEFLDNSIASFYKQENQLSQLYKIFAGIAIFISCLGLYGLVSFMAVQRTKEVGIRKVLGASISRIIYLFSREFTIIIAISFLVAAPIAYLLMQKWLEDFTFRITPGVGIFVMAITGSVLVAWLTVGYRAIKAAIANPVESLRTE